MLISNPIQIEILSEMKRIVAFKDAETLEAEEETARREAVIGLETEVQAADLEEDID
jgi:hypothetical protein